MKRMRLLLIEDDLYDCEQYKAYVEEHSQYILCIANGVKKAIVTLRNSEFDIILLDLEFNNGDGDGIQLLQQMPSLELKTRPYVIITTSNLSKRTHALARRWGADYIFTKDKIDYSPAAVLNFATLYYASLNELMLGHPHNLNEADVKTKVCQLIENLGITNDMKGKCYLIDAIIMVLESPNPIDVQLSKDVYPKIAQRYRKSDQSVEKAIGNAIKKAWRVTDIDQLTRYYTAEVSYTNGFPTNRELIYYMADKLRA